MKNIIDPIPVNKLLEELTLERFVRMTNNGKNEIYVVNAFNAPNVMREIGRLREISFRDSGGGTGLECDLDVFDTDPDNYFEQLIVWNPYDKAIVGGYRYMLCDHLKSAGDGHVDTPTGELFRYSEKFINEYLPYTIELGRSFVQPEYQPSKSLSKGMYSLDNLWDGLGTLCKTIPQAKYFFGKVTMYPQLERMSRDMILYFMKTNFPDPDHLKNVRERGAAVPPLVNAYMNLSSTMRSFGTALNAPFGDVEETGILVTIADIFSSKLERYTTYNPDEKPLHLS